MIAASAARTASDVTTLSSTPANATAASVPTAYSAVFIPASPCSRLRSLRIRLPSLDRSVGTKDLAEHGDDNRDHPGEQERRQEAQPERHHGEDTRPSRPCLCGRGTVGAQVGREPVQ